MGRLTDLMDDAGLRVIDKRWSLPTNPKQGWLYRELDQIDLAVIHHTGGYPNATSNAVARYHIKPKPYYPNGWPGIAYTFYGYMHEEHGPTWDFCHRLRDFGPQAYGVNARAFGIAIAGNYVHERPPLIQIGSLVTLVRVLETWFRDDYGVELDVKPHRHFSNTRCPGKIWDSFVVANNSSR